MPLKLDHQGETSNFYTNDSFPDLMFIERTDRFTIDNVVFPDLVFLKGVVMNQMSNNFMQLLEKSCVVSNPIVATDAYSLSKMGVDETFCGRMIAALKCIPIPLECIVRGYYVEESESWEPYRHNANMFGNVLPKNLKDSEQLPHPIYTPSIKGKVNEPDVNVSFADTIGFFKKFLLENLSLKKSERDTLQSLAFSVASAVRDASVRAYLFAHNYAMHRGIIIADAKLEFGIVQDYNTKKYKLVIISEAFTPDTCRFWDVKSYQIGRPQPSYDKQILKRYVKRILKWDSSSKLNPPSIPEPILKDTSMVYWSMLDRLFDQDFVQLTSDIAWEWLYAQQEADTILV